MTYPGLSGGYDELASLRSDSREPGTRRQKLAGYLKAANELRHSYFAQDGNSYGSKDDAGVEGPGTFPDAAVVRSGNEEMMLFPSYARKHQKSSRPPLWPPPGENEQEYWHREWERHQDDKAIVDVDVRGWIYTPHRGQTNRKQRFAIEVARKICGLPPPNATRPGDPNHSSQAPSRAGSHDRSKHEEDLIDLEVENIMKKGEAEGRFARRGAFSETPKDDDNDSLYEHSSRASSRDHSPDRGRHRLSAVSVASSTDGDAGTITPPHKRSSWHSTKMSSAELAVAHQHLLNRLRLFMANPLTNTPITAFFYNGSASRQHTVYTNPAGHFSCRAALDFIPTHVRVLAGENLSATEEVTITSPKGVSLISDIDDTVKHTSILSGGREIFRNVFTRELGDLTIDGVREWYNTMYDMGVKMHYVSNSPWQLYPVLTSYFKMAHLPKGSFHLKQYTGMLQGIFEPVAERKKSSLEKIFRDFPDRKFILIGDSGEADLEVYTEMAVDNPGRVLGIFIRDVTTPIKKGYFDPSNGPSGGGRHLRSHSGQNPAGSLEMSKRISRPDDIRDDDADLRAAIAASLGDMEAETRHAKQLINPDLPSPDNASTPTPKPSLPPRRQPEQSFTETPVVSSPEEDLIDLREEPTPRPWLAPPVRRNSQMKPSPPPPPKPEALRSPEKVPQHQSPNIDVYGRPPPPRPRKPSSAVKPPPRLLQRGQTWTQKSVLQQAHLAAQHQPSPLSQVTKPPSESKDRPQLPLRPSNHRAATQASANTQNAFSPSFSWQSENATGLPRPTTPGPAAPRRTISSTSHRSMDDMRSSSASTKKGKSIPAPPPRLRNITSTTPAAASRKAANRLSGDGSGGSLPGTPGEANMSKRELMWNQRWARAKNLLDRQGVTLRTWRVGSDVADVCVRLAEFEFWDIEKESKAREKSG